VTFAFFSVPGTHARELSYGFDPTRSLGQCSWLLAAFPEFVGYLELSVCPSKAVSGLTETWG
jgi:hypothetical protein